MRPFHGLIVTSVGWLSNILTNRIAQFVRYKSLSIYITTTYVVSWQGTVRALSGGRAGQSRPNRKADNEAPYPCPRPRCFGSGPSDQRRPGMCCRLLPDDEPGGG